MNDSNTTHSKKNTVKRKSICVNDDCVLLRQTNIYSNFLSRQFMACRNKGDYCDVTLKIGEKVFQCHRLVLASNSTYFSTLFKDDFKEAGEVTKILPTLFVNEKGFSKLLDAMYGARFEIEDDLVPLFTTSMYLQLTYFLDECKTYIEDNLEVLDTIELIALPQLQFDYSLYLLVKKYVCQHFSKLYLRMAGISLEIFEDLFGDSELIITHKDQVLNFGKIWISYDIQNRKQHLQKVASLLKPFHTPSERSIELVKNMATHLQRDYDVQIALNTLLESAEIPSDKCESKLELSSPFFFIKPHNESEILLGTYKANTWTCLSNIQMPVSSFLLDTFEGVIANDMIHVAANQCTKSDIEQRQVLFHGFDGRTEEWVELCSPQRMPECLITCNSMVYSYEHSLTDHQISVFEPFLNRWIKLPALTYPRLNSGIATNDQVLYVIGGFPLRNIVTRCPTNIIEMYDSRCGNWSRIVLSNEHTIPNEDFSKRVCFLDNKLYLLQEDNVYSTLTAVDIRMNKWLNIEMALDLLVSHPIVVDGNLWFISENSENGINVIDVSKVELMANISNPNVFVQPIFTLPC